MTLLDDSIPVEVLVRGRRCVVIGGCDEAASKVERLLRAGARIEVFCPPRAVVAAIERRAASGEVSVVERPCTEQDVRGAAVVFVSPAERETGARLARAAREVGTLVCTLDAPDASTFYNPASAEMSGVRVTVATGGVAPSVAKRLREDLEAVLGDARLARMMAELARLRAALPPGERGDAVRARAEGLRLEARLVLPAWAEGEDPVERAPD